MPLSDRLARRPSMNGRDGGPCQCSLALSNSPFTVPSRGASTEGAMTAKLTIVWRVDATTQIAPVTDLAPSSCRLHIKDSPTAPPVSLSSPHTHSLHRSSPHSLVFTTPSILNTNVFNNQPPNNQHALLRRPRWPCCLCKRICLRRLPSRERDQLSCSRLRGLDPSWIRFVPSLYPSGLSTNLHHHHGQGFDYRLLRSYDIESRLKNLHSLHQHHDHR
jgi:hypothetical protein